MGGKWRGSKERDSNEKARQCMSKKNQILKNGLEKIARTIRMNYAVLDKIEIYRAQMNQHETTSSQ